MSCSSSWTAMVVGAGPATTASGMSSAPMTAMSSGGSLGDEGEDETALVHRGPQTGQLGVVGSTTLTVV